MDKILCHYCNKEFSKYGIKNHISIVHEGKIERVAHFVKKGKPAWNKGLTKETDKRVKDIAEKTSIAQKGKSGHIPTDSDKKKISNGMKKAHSEGRAWNIGKSRWNNEPSYPEKFFMKVIENEFHDKNYQREFNVGIYSIDFAWIDKKIAIEIDGQQHERFEEYKLRDQRKDLYLTENGWFIYRIKWSEFFNNTIETINTLKHIIDNNSQLNEIK